MQIAKCQLPSEEDRAACLTPPGTGAIATIAVRGPRAWETARELFQSSKPLPDEPPPGRFWLGRFGDESADEVVLSVKRAVPSPWLELHCHGGIQVVRMLLELLAQRGIEVCSWQELEASAPESETKAVVAAELTKACTTRTAGVLLDQYHGAFERAIRAILAALERGEVSEASRRLSELVRFAGVGRHLTSPWRVVVAGAPNVGKSSLVNALAGFQRSVVSPTPGTTRDVVTTRIAVDGWPIELADTAGLREGSATVEAEGIALAIDAVAGADLCLWVLDAAAPPIFPADEAPSVPLRLVVNKIDLPAEWELDRVADAVRVSARTREGMEELCRSLAQWLVPTPPQPGAPVPFTASMCERVAEAARLVEAGKFADVQVLLAAFMSRISTSGRQL